MPIPTTSHDSLPYIDPPPPSSGPHSLAAATATALLTSSLPTSHKTTPHPSLPALRPQNLTPLAQSEQSRIARREPLTGGIDTTRYELSSSSSSSSSSSTTDLRTRLQQAYISSSHLSTRLQHLALLERYGKNAWLVGNAQLEGMLAGVEKELVEMREEVGRVNRERKGAQEGGRGELEGLERGWREGVGRVVEVEVAVAGVEERVRGVLREGGGEFGGFLFDGKGGGGEGGGEDGC